MNEQEKSLKLAELMGWNPYIESGVLLGTVKQYSDDDIYLQPYLSSKDGFAQFAAILLKFPEVMSKVVVNMGLFVNTKNDAYVEVTQANILDEILRMNGVDV